MKYRSENQRYVELGKGLVHKINTAFNKRPVRITKDHCRCNFCIFKEEL